MTEQLSQPETLSSLPVSQPAGPVSTSEAELKLIEALRQGDETAFVMLIDQYHTALLRLALIYTSSRAVAEEIVQETWIGVLQGIHRFEGRSSLKTWIFRILINQAKKRAQRENRQIPFSALWNPEAEPDEPAVALDRFQPADDPKWPGHWVSQPERWDDIPESRLLSEETRAYLLQAIENLPPSQQEVITLRDIEGWSPEEVCNLLGITEVNQRVLLHRARSKVRGALEQYFKP
jgi:RNA polymerase sigma-70 factor (ECF subfamily)